MDDEEKESWIREQVAFSGITIVGLSCDLSMVSFKVLGLTLQGFEMITGKELVLYIPNFINTICSNTLPNYHKRLPWLRLFGATV